MNRRDAVLALVTLGVAPLGAEAQQPQTVARVGILEAGASEAGTAGRKVFVESLQALGWTERRNLMIDERFANTRMADLPHLAAELLRLKPDVILCVGPAPAVAIKNLTSSVPAVFAIVADPVGIGLAKSLGRPEGNFTGLATIVPELFLAKQMELLRETVPHATRVAFLTNPGNPVHTKGRDLRLRVAREQGLSVVELQARTRDDLELALPEAARQKADVMYVSGDPLALMHRQLIADLALKHRLPVMYLFEQHVDAGGLMSYGTDLLDIYRRAAAYVDKILKGALPRDLPIEQPTRFQLVINLKTAKALGIKIPQTVLLRADRVIE